MKRKKPSHDLAQLQDGIRSNKLRIVYTKKALEGAANIGYSKAKIKSAILSLTEINFYGAMDAVCFPGEKMDVYHFPDPKLIVYIKFHVNSVVVVSSCKKK